MQSIADVLLWLVLAALVLVVLLRTLGSLRGLLRILSAATEQRHRRALAGPVLLTALGGSALLVAPQATPSLATPWLERAVAITFAIGITWLVATALDLAVLTMLARHDTAVADNLDARRMHTQYGVLLRIARIVVWVLGVAAILSTFPEVRALGNGLLASAGIAGLVLGLAAQRTLGNFLAGIQIALTQPVRLDDAVVIDEEWGWIEEITTTYVVVKIWDERRLIVPFSKLLEQPFQNWTRNRADLLGSVMLWADYRVQVAAVRQELASIVGQTDLWDGRVAVLQVVECTDRAVQLRALVSASTSPRAWDLRCHVRELLIAFLAREHAVALPTMRAEIESAQRQRQADPAPTPILDPNHETPDVGGLPGEPPAHVDATAELEPASTTA